MSLKILISKIFDGVLEDCERDHFDVELSHFDNFKCHDFVGNLFFRPFTAVDCFNCLVDTNITDDFESLSNLINRGEVFSSLS
jgi:hypothetical protein